jgi:hypothetical protein
MNRRSFLRATFLSAALAGCASPKKKPPGKMTKAELEADMAARLNLTDVALTDEGGGRFTGTGKDREGRVFQLEVTQEERRLSWKNTYKSADGTISTSGGGTASW